MSRGPVSLLNLPFYKNVSLLLLCRLILSLTVSTPLYLCLDSVHPHARGTSRPYSRSNPSLNVWLSMGAWVRACTCTCVCVKFPGDFHRWRVGTRGPSPVTLAVSDKGSWVCNLDYLKGTRGGGTEQGSTRHRKDKYRRLPLLGVGPKTVVVPE